MPTKSRLTLPQRPLNAGLALILALVAPSLCFAGADSGAKKKFVDDAGRELSVPERIGRVYSTSPVGNVFLYALAPEKMVGWNYALTPEEARYLLPETTKLPALGGWFGENGRGNVETLLSSRPDAILSVGYSDRTSNELSERVQKQTGIPVIVASGRLERTADTFELIAKLIDREEEGKKFAAYSRKALKDNQDLVAALPEGKPLKVYYAEGIRGLQTDTQGSLHAELIEMVGATNVAQGPETSGFGRISVSLEQVIAWQPDVILICPEKNRPEGEWRPEWLSVPGWDRIKAVQTGRVYQIPGQPFNWFDRPPSAARLLGLKWLAWVLYPDKVGFDMVEETRTFYRMFFHYEMSHEEASNLLENSRTIVRPTMR